MGELVSRYLGETLIAAASTLALFAATNWGALFLVGSESFVKRCFFYLMHVLYYPWYFLLTSVQNAWCVHSVQKRLQQDDHAARRICCYDSRSIAIISLCPILIELPRGTSSEDCRGYKLVKDDRVKRLCPLELPPNADHAAVRGGRSDEISSNQESQILQGQNEERLYIELGSGPMMRDDPLSGIDMSNKSSSAEIFIDILSLQFRKVWRRYREFVFGELREALALLRESLRQLRDVGRLLRRVGFREAFRQLRERRVSVSMIAEIPSNLAHRGALLELGLAPDPNQLCYLRSRSLFETVVTGLQGGAYLLSVIHRMLQHLAITPLEAIISFLSIMVICELLIEFYACGHYDRPLLLRLSPPQFSRFLNGPRNPHPNFLYHFKLLTLSFQILAFLLISVPSLYYAHHYHHLNYPLCFYSALMFLIAMFLSMLGFTGLLFDVPAAPLVVYYGGCTYVVSLVLAVTATVKYWEIFNKAHKGDWFAWLPRLSSS